MCPLPQSTLTSIQEIFSDSKRAVVMTGIIASTANNDSTADVKSAFKSVAKTLSAASTTGKDSELKVSVGKCREADLLELLDDVWGRDTTSKKVKETAKDEVEKPECKQEKAPRKRAEPDDQNPKQPAAKKARSDKNDKLVLAISKIDSELNVLASKIVMSKNFNFAKQVQSSVSKLNSVLTAECLEKAVAATDKDFASAVDSGSKMLDDLKAIQDLCSSVNGNDIATIVQAAAKSLKVIRPRCAQHAMFEKLIFEKVCLRVWVCAQEGPCHMLASFMESRWSGAGGRSTSPTCRWGHADGDH
jgi:hypothetical protein